MPASMAHHGSSNPSYPEPETGIFGQIPASRSQYQPELQTHYMNPLPQSMIRCQTQYRLGPNPPMVLCPLSTGFRSRVTLPSMLFGRGPRTGD
ncbi:hypothetical protein M9H77_09171 [Catharanthus roseus]|uniref:Uncharacterized protein n=1 Tax=Catharanthus roseus TaxID=4058 RepID=A0ACC0C096_CATRO|nr:hypothetical protein M9H77_09171 [Catharanthus roseus]